MEKCRGALRARQHQAKPATCEKKRPEKMYAPKKHYQTRAVAKVIQGERHHPKWAAQLDNIGHVVLIGSIG